MATSDSEDNLFVPQFPATYKEKMFQNFEAMITGIVNQKTEIYQEQIDILAAQNRALKAQLAQMRAVVEEKMKNDERYKFLFEAQTTYDLLHVRDMNEVNQRLDELDDVPEPEESEEDKGSEEEVAKRYIHPFVRDVRASDFPPAWPAQWLS